MIVSKESVALLVKSRVNALVCQTLENRFNVENSGGTLRLNSQNRSHIVNLLSDIDAKTGLFKTLNLMMQRYLETREVLSTIVKTANKRLHERFFERSSFRSRLYYYDEEQVVKTLRSLAYVHAQRDFAEALRLVEKSVK